MQMTVPTRNTTITAMLSIILGFLALAGSANSAPSPSSPSSTTATASAPATTYTVDAGLNGFSFTPNSLTANVGDVVTFLFYPQNHSVAQAEYGYPCIPYANPELNKTGFWSGFQPVNNISENAPRFSIRINDTDPVFFYCSAPQACIQDGMIGVINPNATQSLANQQAFVKNATLQLSPGEAYPAESTPSPTPPPSSAGGSSSGISVGAIAGIVVGAIVVLALAGLAFYLCGRNRSLATVLRYSQPPRHARPQNIPPVPYTPSPVHTPYSPEFAPKQDQSPPLRPDLNSHDSWQTYSTSQPLRPTSPEMAPAGGLSPQLFDQGYGYGYHHVENPGNNIAAYQGHPGPGSPPWPQPASYNQVQYAQAPNEVAIGQEPLASPGQLSYATHQSHLSHLSGHSSQQGQSHQIQPIPSVPEVHELDARSTAPEDPYASPPRYASRTFSFSEGSDGPPGVEKVLRD